MTNTSQRCRNCGLVNSGDVAVCRRCGFSNDPSPYLVPAIPHLAGRESPTPDSSSDQTLELLQVGVIIIAFILAVIAGGSLWYNGVGGAPSLACFFVVLIGGSIGGLVGLSVIRRRYFGKGGGLVAVDDSELLNRFGLTNAETATVTVVPTVISTVFYRVAPSTNGKLWLILSAYGLIWGGAFLVGTYRQRRRSRH